jgi:hypothetical protein
MEFKCKSPGCKGHVVYIPRKAELLTLFQTDLSDNFNKTLELSEFKDSVNRIVAADSNYNTTKQIFLNCDLDSTHIFGYQIPSNN